MVAVKQIQLDGLKTEKIKPGHEVDLVKRLSNPNIHQVRAYEGMVRDGLMNPLQVSMVVECVFIWLRPVTTLTCCVGSA
jgi:hypothetical protein